MKSNTLLSVGLSLGLMLSPAALVDAQSQTYPDRAITLVVGLSPGGSSDTIAREIARGLAEELGVNVVVENRPGANTMIASAHVAQSDPDGYTLLVSSSMNATNPWVYSDVGYDYENDLRHIVLLGVAPNLMAVSADLPFDTLSELVEFAKENPGEFAYASAGVGSVHHLLMELIAEEFEIELTHVPYPGGGPAIQDAVAGHVDAYFGTISSIRNYIESGDLKGLFVTSDERSSVMPHVETMEENGIVGMNSGYWLGLAAPAGVPDEIIFQLNRAANNVLADPAVIERLTAQVIEPGGGTPEEMEVFFEQELSLWKAAADAAQIDSE